MHRFARHTVLFVLAVLTYRRALSAYFFDDDLQWLVGSWAFSPANLWALGRMDHFYRPTIDLYFAVCSRLFAGSPILFHAASIAMHAAVSITLFVFLRRLTRDGLYAFIAATFFVLQPGGIDAVAWVGALAETLGALFGCLSLLWFLEWRENGRAWCYPASWLAYAAALLTHESSVVFLPLLVLTDWVHGEGAVERRHLHREHRLRAVAGYGVLTAVYLAVDLFINSRNYIVREGHYTAGWHMVGNGLRYIESMYVGRFDLLNDAVVVLLLLALLVRGTGRVRLAVLWMLLALLPFVPFTWANTSRYMYQPAIGLSMLMAEAICALASVLESRTGRTMRIALVTLVVVVLAGRSMRFATHNVAQFAVRTETYRQEGRRLRALNGPLTSHSVIRADDQLRSTLAYPFANALVAWIYQDPTITLEQY
ncbi:MAG: hypothetical protein U0Q11_22885 [Vicinamibacterales bacterium]